MLKYTKKQFHAILSTGISICCYFPELFYSGFVEWVLDLAKAFKNFSIYRTIEIPNVIINLRFINFVVHNHLKVYILYTDKGQCHQCLYASHMNTELNILQNYIHYKLAKTGSQNATNASQTSHANSARVVDMQTTNKDKNCAQDSGYVKLKNRGGRERCSESLDMWYVD